jgi:hypothetical protein
MRRSFGFFAGGLASLAMLGGAQAKMVRYEINGQRYSYNTNNRQQVEEARGRLAAANPAYAARGSRPRRSAPPTPSPQCWARPHSARPRKRWPVSGT